MIVFIAVVFIAAGYYAYVQIYPPINPLNKFGNVANERSGGKTIMITLYHVDWCPHCKTAMPEWDKFDAEYNSRFVNGYKISCVKQDCTDSSDPKIKNMLEKEPAIDSFPTVRGVMVGESGKDITIQFKSRISKDNLEKFILSISAAK